MLVLLAGCASGPRGGTGIGRDGADANPPAGLSQVPDAEPRVEAIRSSGGTSKPYVVLGRSYVPITDDRPLRETGLASWYGRKFHSQSTASGEPYDMYAMTAAHKTLPLPSYVRVRNPANGREVIVRVNDRGPFHDGRIIDLSYTAALKLDLLRGVAPVEIERITNEDIRAGTWRRGDAGATALALGMPAAAARPAQRARVRERRRAHGAHHAGGRRAARGSEGARGPAAAGAGDVAARAAAGCPAGIAAPTASGCNWAPSASATASTAFSSRWRATCRAWRRRSTCSRSAAPTGCRPGPMPRANWRATRRSRFATACSSRRVIVERR